LHIFVALYNLAIKIAMKLKVESTVPTHKRTINKNLHLEARC